MLQVEERAQLMMEIPCKCGGKAEHRIGTVQHYVGLLRILVNNVPHFHCPYCGKQSYDIKTNVSPLLKIAYSRRLNEIDWNTKDLYL